MAEADPPLIRKLKKVLETRLENDLELVESLKAVSEFFTENNIRTRRSLRSDIEKRNVVIYEEFLDSFKMVKDDLDELYEAVSVMNSSCKDMSCRLQEAKSQTEHLVRETSRIQRESEEFDIKSRIADAMLEMFQLTHEQEQQLVDQSAPLTEDFFAALQRARQIHSDCKLLLMSQNQTAGLEIMEQMSVLMESGCEKLYRWAQAQCRLQAADSAEITPIMVHAFKVLQDRPVLFKYALDEYANARRNAIVRAFLDALTRGSSSSSAKPIELHSHDPLRYIGDMLAWLHQATAGEIESLDALLRECCVEVGQEDEEQQQQQVKQLRANCLISLTDNLCRPLRLRVEQVLVGQQDPTVLYSVRSLLRFHLATLERVLDNQCQLCDTVRELAQLSWRLFHGSLTASTQRAMETVQPLQPFSLESDCLHAPAAVGETLQLLQQVLTASDAAMLPLMQRKDDIKQVLDVCISPLVQLCTVTAEKLGELEMAIFMVNSLHAMQCGLAAYEFTQEQIERLQAQLEPQLDTLVTEQLSYILQQVQLLDVYHTVTKHESDPNANKGPLSESTASCLTPAALKLSMSKFDAYLANPDSLTLQQLQALQSSKLRQLVAKQCADQLHSVYGIIYRALTNEANCFGSDVKAVLVRSPDQVAKLIF